MRKEFANYINSNNITYKYAKGMRDIIGKEFHNYHEIFLFKGGDAEFVSEKFRQRLIPDTLIIIPADFFHQFIVHGEESEYIRCVFNFDGTDELSELTDKKINDVRLIRANDEITDIFKKLNKCYEEYGDSHNSRIAAKAYLTLLLLLLDDTEKSSGIIPVTFNPITYSAVKYINHNIKKQLKISDIAKELHVSVSYLNHIFKADLQISVHKYILDKKFLLINRRITLGEVITHLASEYGFNDYSGFYKQYKKRFGVKPSATTVKK